MVTRKHLAVNMLNGFFTGVLVEAQHGVQRGLEVFEGPTLMSVLRSGRRDAGDGCGWCVDLLSKLL